MTSYNESPRPSSIQRTLAVCGAETFARRRKRPLEQVADFEELRAKSLDVELRYDHILSRFSVELSPPLLHATDRDENPGRPYWQDLSVWGAGPIDCRGDVADQVAKELRAMAERWTAAADAVEAQRQLCEYDILTEG